MVPNFSEARDPARNVPARAAGFTVIELMITVALLAILTALALPSFRSFIINNRLAGQANEVAAALNFARAEALKRGSWAELRANAGGLTDGWVVQVDPAALAPGEANPIRVWPAVDGSIAVTAAQNQVRFLRSGCFDHDEDGDCSSHFGTGGAETPVFTFTESPDIESIEARLMWVNGTGRVAVCREDPNNDGQCK